MRSSEQMVLLKDEPDVALVELDARPRLHGVCRLTGEPILAPPIPVQHAQDRQQRRFSGTGGPHDRDKVTRFDLEIDPPEDEGFTRTGLI